MKLAEEMGGNSQATIWGSGLKTSLLLAALANGTAAHALDLDDTNAVMMAHPSIQLLPALFALGELKHATGQEIILGYIIGFEVGAKLGRAMNPDFVAQGWFPVGPLGTLMQTAACSKLLNLDVGQIENALGIAANLAAGLRCNNGTMAKPLMAGSAASSALLAVLSASDGMTANCKALEDRFGFFENFSRGDAEKLKQSFEKLGDPLEITYSGLAHKLYP
ncbi:MAG: MmgE/PrpD family protein, partial [Deltaproteobacteria bacterium]|nr:MmgE/PrpD family protein [Deltaproteobacteria bacterium]